MEDLFRPVGVASLSVAEPSPCGWRAGADCTDAAIMTVVQRTTRVAVCDAEAEKIGGGVIFIDEESSRVHQAPSGITVAVGRLPADLRRLLSRGAFPHVAQTGPWLELLPRNAEGHHPWKWQQRQLDIYTHLHLSLHLLGACNHRIGQPIAGIRALQHNGQSLPGFL